MEKKILIVDDEVNFSVLLAKRLTQAGYIVESASNGKEAIGSYIKALYDKAPFSVILLDMRMPDLNGIETLEILRQEEKLRGIKSGAGVSVIVLTAYDEPWMDPLMIKDCDDYIVKSCDNKELIRKIGNCIKKKSKRANPPK